jgi:hypothetical protein
MSREKPRVFLVMSVLSFFFHGGKGVWFVEVFEGCGSNWPLFCLLTKLLNYWAVSQTKFELSKIRAVKNSSCQKFELSKIRAVKNSSCQKFELLKIRAVNNSSDPNSQSKNPSPHPSPKKVPEKDPTGPMKKND